MAVRTDSMEARNQQEISAGNVAWLVGRMFFIPFRTLLHGMEMLVQAMRGFQRAGDLGMQVLAGTDADEQSTGTQPTTYTESEPLSSYDDAAAGGSDNDETRSWEKISMDKNLNDDMLKLVRYKVLFVKRGYEYAFPEREALVWDNMDGSAFTAWKIAEFVQMLPRKDTRVPHEWVSKSYPPVDDQKYRDG